MDSNLTEYILHPDRLNASTLPVLARLVARYPYFQAVRMLYLRNLYQLHDRSFGEELKKAALYVDRSALYYYLEGNRLHSDLALQEAHRSSEVICNGDESVRADSIINSFLSRRPEDRVRKPRTPDAATDYIAYMLLNEKETELTDHSGLLPKMPHQDLIDDFIDKSGGRFQLPKENQTMMSDTEDLSVESGQEQMPEEDEFLTETLAKIYIKQGRYGKAIEIIRKLSLKNPKKNRYFADQIRFLEKLIINNKYK